jgi:hypothetical protein
VLKSIDRHGDLERRSREARMRIEESIGLRSGGVESDLTEAVPELSFSGIVEVKRLENALKECKLLVN